MFGIFTQNFRQIYIKNPDGPVAAVIVNIKLTWSLLRAFGFGVYYPDDPHTRHAGVRIDIPVHATVEGLHTGCDEILEKALEMVRTGEYDPAAEK